MNKLTKPSAHTPRGIFVFLGAVGVISSGKAIRENSGMRARAAHNFHGHMGQARNTLEFLLVDAGLMRVV